MKLLVWALVFALLLFAAWTLPGNAEPVRFTLEVGTLNAKYGVAEQGLGFPLFGRPKFYLDTDFSWSPPVLRAAGVAVVAGFRWQALSTDMPGSGGFRYVDGPKLALRGSWGLE